jgi:hypothetical protein
MRGRAIAVCVIVLAPLSTACSSTRAPSFVERCAVDDVIARYEQSREGDLLATTAPEIRVKGTHAWARYRMTRRTGQIMGNPVLVELERGDSGWTVVSEREDWPWWRPRW